MNRKFVKENKQVCTRDSCRHSIGHAEALGYDCDSFRGEDVDGDALYPAVVIRSVDFRVFFIKQNAMLQTIMFLVFGLFTSQTPSK